ncbi:MAG: hypothetical protein WCY11_11145 [Novosphingobium sp.]
MFRFLLVVALGLASTACVSKLAYGRVKEALLDAGLSERNASCMADRMTDKLTIGQLRKLERLKGEKRSLMDYVAAVRQVDDLDAVEVTVSSAALCATGLVR